MDIPDKLATVLDVPLYEFRQLPETGAKRPKSLPGERPPRGKA
jgi:hypothetical protein